MSRFLSLFLVSWALLLAFAQAWPVETNAAPAPRRKRDDNIPNVSAIESTIPKSSSEIIPVVSKFNSKDTKNNNDKSTSDKKDNKSGDTTDTNTKDDKKTDSDSDNKSDTKTKDDKKTTEKPTPTSIDPRLPAGTISMVTPAATESTYIKIGQNATFKWEYVSLIVTPEKLNILATCSINTAQTLTLATNHPAGETSYVWDTKKTDDLPSVELLTAKYSLIMLDSTSNLTAFPRAGYLSPLSFTMGLYRPQSYSPFPEDATYVNGGMLLEPVVLKWIVGLSVIVAAAGLQTMLS